MNSELPLSERTTADKKLLGFIRIHAGILTVCILFFFLGIISLNTMLVYTPDSARYLAWSESLARFEGFRDMTTPEPSKYVVHAPLYSVFLAPTAWLSTVNVMPAKIVTTLFGIAVLVALYSWSSTRIGRRWATILAALVAVHPATILYSTQVLSDVPFAFCVVLFFYLLEREMTAGPAGSPGLVMLTVTIVAGIFLREVGLTLVMASTVLLVLKKKYRIAFLILAVAVGAYLLWYIRNEVIIAAVEQPPMRNSQIFLSHLFTPKESSILQEFAARIRNNLGVYGAQLGRLPFMDETVLRNISTTAPSQFPVFLAFAAMPYIFHLFLVVTVIGVLIGCYYEAKAGPRFLILVVFTACYLVPIILYPISDTRFLYPIVLMMMYLFVVGLKTMVEKASVVWQWFTAVRGLDVMLLVALSFPNVAWTTTFVSNSWRYNQSPVEFFNAIKELRAYPEVFARPVSLAGSWLAAHTDTSEIIVCRWKELGLYTGGRRVFDLDPQILLDPFERILRDYDVHYIVTLVSRGGLREFEQLFAQSDLFHFETVYRVANVEVVKVLPGEGKTVVGVSPQDSSQTGIELRFKKAVRLLGRGKVEECVANLNTFPAYVRRESPIVFTVGVADEFTGKLAEAKKIFERFHGYQQAGSFLLQSWYHLEIISRLTNAMNASEGYEAAQNLQVVAAYYWALGYRNQSLVMLDRAIRADSAFFPAVIFRAIYSLQNGDTATSAYFFGKAKSLDPSNVLVPAFGKILDNLRLLNRRHDAESDTALQMDNVRQYLKIGLRENAIDGLLSLYEQNPGDQDCLRMLVELYKQKRRFEPALVYLRKLEALRPDDVALHDEIRALESRW
jgi:tetratricopeptide (TPR) repeat protein/4-amino-4-deoxy-L-arabinose transferase-like glycosyltransferase